MKHPTNTNSSGALCPACQVAFAPGDSFCEACGGPLPEPEELCAACGGIVLDGYCDHCGLKKPAPRDHIERSWPGVAAATDKGKRHYRNEDAFAVAVGRGSVAVVVNDGVSSTVRSDEASQAAADAAIALLEVGGVKRLPDAYVAARAAVTSLPWTPLPDMGPPSCTYLAAVVTDANITWTSMGDCRAYWVEPNDACQLTEDDSVAAEMVRRGELSAADAHDHEGYHIVTRWLAVDADPEWDPVVMSAPINGPGRVVVCSDGLWNYTPTASDMRVAMGSFGDDVVTVTRRLCQFALDGGGHDNIAVVVIDIPLVGGTAHP